MLREAAAYCVGCGRGLSLAPFGVGSVFGNGKPREWRIICNRARSEEELVLGYAFSHLAGITWRSVTADDCEALHDLSGSECSSHRAHVRKFTMVVVVVRFLVKETFWSLQASQSESIGSIHVT